MTGDATYLTDQERLDWLRLIRSDRVGPVTFRKLLEQFGSAGAALDALPTLAKRGGGKSPKLYSISDAERELEAMGKVGVTLVGMTEPDYPLPLRVLEGSPPVLCVRGHVHLLRRQAIGMVGARNASVNGNKMAKRLASQLGEAGFLVVSGMARGIDTSVHEGAMATGTVAVVAGGVDVIYPKENTRLYEQICETGAVVSEMPMGVKPIARHFPQRNRIVSGMSYGVVVVEAARRSGSLITARLAGEQGREVFAVPGSPLDPRAEGPNKLIRDGATLTETAGDVLSVLNDILRRPLAERKGPDFTGPPEAPLDEKEVESHRGTIINSLSLTPVTVDEIVRQCQLSPSTVSMILLELELAGRIERHPGNQVSLLG